MADSENQQNWKRLESLFYRALEMDAAQRTQFLDEACGDDTELRSEVQSLLDSAMGPTDFLVKPVESAARGLYEQGKAPVLVPGQTFDHYRVVSLAGAGGMGQVYLAEDIRLGRDVALKILSPDLVGDPRSVQRFEHEALAASALNHPNIVTIYDVGEFERTHFIAAEFIDGPTLRKQLGEGKMEIAAALGIALQIASGLVAAQGSGIVHRDVKPENILLRQDGIAKLVDFGIVKLGEESRARRKRTSAAPLLSTTKSGMKLGTTRYMSPEQARGLEVDGRTDVFSLGTVIYEMVSGKAPFEGESDSDVVAEILKTDPPRLDEVLPDCPSELARIVAKAMAKDLGARYQNVRELFAELSALRQEVEFRAKLDVTPHPSAAVPALRASSSRMRYAAIGVVAAVVVAGAGFGIWKHFAGQTVFAQPRTLAILPFHNIRPDPATDFLGFSLADAIITKLGYVGALTVRPSSAVEKYRNQTIDPRDAARALNVDTLLTGSYVKDGSDLRITVQLIDIKSMNMLWRDLIDIQYGNVLTIDDLVAGKIISGLELSLSPSESARLKLDTPRTEAAYEEYLRGVDLYALNDFESSIAMLEKSAATDPSFALTWAHLGQAYEANASLQFGGRGQYQKATDAYQRALQLNPDLVEARVNMANLLIDTGKVEEAVPLLRTALRSYPNSAGAHWELGYAYRFGGLLEESVRECERAREIDPGVKITSSAINAYFYLGQYDRWLVSLPESNSAYILFYRGFGEYYKGDYRRAAALFDLAYDTDPALLPAVVGKVLSDSIGHQTAAGLQLLRQTAAKVQERGVTDAEAIYKMAQAYAVLGDAPAALGLLGQAIDGGFFCYPYFRTDPLLDHLRNEREFTILMERARLRYEQFKAKFSPAASAF